MANHIDSNTTNNTGLISFFKRIWQHRNLAFTVGYAELQQTVFRYPLSYLWWLLDPIFLMICYVFLVEVLGRGVERDGVPFYLYVSVGVLQWHWTSSCISGSLRLVTQYAAQITQINFPIYTLVIARFIKETVLYLIGTMVLLIILLIWGKFANISWVYLPFMIILHGLFLFSVMSFLAAIGVFIPDLEKLLPFILRLWFFATPILYESKMLLKKLPADVAYIYKLNPMVYLAENYRGAVLFSEIPSLNGAPELILTTLIIWLVSIWLFKITSRIFRVTFKGNTMFDKILNPIIAHDLGIKFKNYGTKRPTIKQRLSSVVKNKQKYVWALSNVSFEVHPGETFFIIGRNGAGKTTLLKILARTLKPDTGHLTVNGGIGAFLSMGLGFTPTLSGIDNAYLSLAFMGLTRAQCDEIIPSIIQFSQLGSYIHAPTKIYSAGMKARLAFAVATAVEPDILVMDEVISAGDEEFREKSQKRIDEILSNARAVIIATHNLGNVVKMASRAMWIEKGRVQSIGEPKDVVAQYREFIKEVRNDPMYDLRNNS